MQLGQELMQVYRRGGLQVAAVCEEKESWHRLCVREKASSWAMQERLGRKGEGLRWGLTCVREGKGAKSSFEGRKATKIGLA